MAAGPRRQFREMWKAPVAVREQAPHTAAYGEEAAALEENRVVVGGCHTDEQQQETPAGERGAHPAVHLAAESIAPGPGHIVMDPAQGCGRMEMACLPC
jgi:hypothetical protein